MTDLNLSIIIVTYNSAGVIGSCLNAMGGEMHRNVILVDNNSTDDTLTIAQSHGVTILALQKNIGFGQAANLGARASDARFLCFLNPDCEPEKNFFIQGVKTVQNDRRICAVPKLMDEHGTEQSGRQPGYTGLKLLSDMILTNYGHTGICRFLERLPEFHNTRWFWPHGACLFIEKITFLSINGFSSRHFMYMEDVVLGCELYRIGSQVIEFDSRLLHREGKGSDTGTGERRRLLNRARRIYALDRHGFWLVMLMTAISVPAELLQQLTRKH